MIFKKDDIPANANLSAQADILAEALPWIKTATGRTVVIKYGGSAMVDPDLRSSVMSDIVLLKLIGLNPVIVHGGGSAINEAFARYEIPVEFKNGLRVTTDAAMEVVKMVLVGQVNQDLVRDLNKHGNLAVGISGNDGGTLVAEQLDPELGRVGRVTYVNTELLHKLIADDFIPVLATVALGEDGGCYNINADVAAGQVARAIGAYKTVFLTDVDGIYLDFEDKGSLISKMTRDEAQAMIDDGTASSGMIPKLESCIAAVDAGVPRAFVINGTTPHALLLELLTDTGIGTMIYGEGDSSAGGKKSLSTLASKLLVNME
ncbi:MAG: acetylglutamate kinase [Eggerthellaceae bacterium]|nr:acetylglutamate kinase [Eggerthellaceae bacterium]